MMSNGGYNLTGIWQYPVSELGQIVDPNRDVSGNDPVSFEHQLKECGGVRRRRDREDEAAKNDGDGKRIKTSTAIDENQDPKAEAEPGSGMPVEQKTPEPPKQDYIHVRARRGQATDSHSLAERARREKISERMKILEDLVPGCNKVIGKAIVLDEIINYVQSLQHQVEFLSMKLEAVNSRMNPAIESFPPKDYGNNQTFDTSGMAFGSQATREYSRDTSPVDTSGMAFGSQATREYSRDTSSPEWLHIGGAFERTT